jgi:uncharacterized membrane protein HdeD (DUF308 family)
MTRSESESVVQGLWWLLLVRGILSILFGVFALAAPGSALLALVIVFGFYAVLDGITAIVLGLRHRGAESHWGWHVVQGVISVVAGIVAFAWPGVTALAILFVIAFWSIVSGAAVIAESFAMRRRGVGEWGWTLAGGVVSVLFGIVLLIQPGAGLLTLLWLVGTFSVVFGIIVVVWAFRLRRAAGALAAGA